MPKNAFRLGATVVVLLACNPHARSTSRLPELHRPSATACTMPRPAGTILAKPPATAHLIPASRRECVVDADCARGYNGRCLVDARDSRGMNIEPFSRCSYDECVKDADCPQRPAACLCREMAKGGLANVCVTAGCTTDAECGRGLACSPTVPFDEGAPAATPQFTAFRCHTLRDECIDDGGCPVGSACAFSKQQARWVCDIRAPLPPD
jgi:hypothetical protein